MLYSREDCTNITPKYMEFVPKKYRPMISKSFDSSFGERFVGSAIKLVQQIWESVDTDYVYTVRFSNRTKNTCNVRECCFWFDNGDGFEKIPLKVITFGLETVEYFYKFGFNEYKFVEKEFIVERGGILNERGWYVIPKWRGLWQLTCHEMAHAINFRSWENYPREKQKFILWSHDESWQQKYREILENFPFESTAFALY